MDVLKELLVDIGIAETRLDQIQPDTRLRADLGLSSLETTDLEIQLRERYDVRINLWDQVDYSVGQLADGIRETPR
ncbi:acyl carrier protein [Streptomyces sp. LE64]|uniref:acyl carrier protein n=1 Tax=Streptomyces sp. LE64 TaxID=3448653 RepID=UPI004042EE37